MFGYFSLLVSSWLSREFFFTFLVLSLPFSLDGFNDSFFLFLGNFQAAGVMGEGKRKTAMADEATENPQKSRRLDTDAAEALLDLSHSPPSKGEAEAATGDSTYDIGSCEHLFKDSEDLDEIARDLRDAHKPPKCEHYPCSTTWRGAAGMMVCTECSLTFCTGEKGARGHPQGHAAWHAASDQHWVALWCDEPSKGYCFECKHILMLGQNKAIEDNYALVPRNKKDEWGMVASSPKVDSAVLPRNVDWGMLGSNVMHPTGMLGSNAMDPWGMLGSNAMDRWGTMGSNAMDRCEMVAGDDHVVRGIPNLGNTCYMNAALQCLLALGKLRTMFLRPDARLGDIGLHLKQLFVATSCGNNATQMPDPEMMPTYMWSLYPDRFQRKVMGDSHEFLASLCDALHNEVEQLNNLQGEAMFPTFSNSIFSCELLDMVSCKVCSHDEVSHYSLHGIQLAAPSKDPLARSKPLQVGKSMFQIAGKAFRVAT
jgi:ubiquitin carboxyl-terminal hydrolase 16/45